MYNESGPWIKMFWASVVNHVEMIVQFGGVDQLMFDERQTYLIEKLFFFFFPLFRMAICIWQNKSEEEQRGLPAPCNENRAFLSMCKG